MIFLIILSYFLAVILFTIVCLFVAYILITLIVGGIKRISYFSPRTFKSFVNKSNKTHTHNTIIPDINNIPETRNNLMKFFYGFFVFYAPSSWIHKPKVVNNLKPQKNYCGYKNTLNNTPNMLNEKLPNFNDHADNLPQEDGGVNQKRT